jgi:hypothetical protein
MSVYEDKIGKGNGAMNRGSFPVAYMNNWIQELVSNILQ